MFGQMRERARLRELREFIESGGQPSYRFRPLGRLICALIGHRHGHLVFMSPSAIIRHCSRCGRNIVHH